MKAFTYNKREDFLGTTALKKLSERLSKKRRQQKIAWALSIFLTAGAIAMVIEAFRTRNELALLTAILVSMFMSMAWSVVYNYRTELKQIKVDPVGYAIRSKFEGAARAESIAPATLPRAGHYEFESHGMSSALDEVFRQLRTAFDQLSKLRLRVIAAGSDKKVAQLLTDHYLNAYAEARQSLETLDSHAEMLLLAEQYQHDPLLFAGEGSRLLGRWVNKVSIQRRLLKDIAARVSGIVETNRRIVEAAERDQTSFQREENVRLKRQASRAALKKLRSAQ